MDHFISDCSIAMLHYQKVKPASHGTNLPHPFYLNAELQVPPHRHQGNGQYKPGDTFVTTGQTEGVEAGNPPLLNLTTRFGKHCVEGDTQYNICIYTLCSIIV